MSTRLALIVLPLLAFAVLVVACGDGPDDEPTPTPTLDPAEFGPTPELGGNILEINPGHGAVVSQSQTRSPNPSNPTGGVCVRVTFEDTPQYAQWFRMAIDDREVTTELTWIVPTREDPDRGTMCYSPEDGLEVGRHTAAVVVQNPLSSSEPTRQTVAWAFEVVPDEEE